MTYYNGQQLDSYKDYNLRFCLGGRNIGKSTYWQIRFMAQAIRKKNKRKFLMIVRTKEQLDVTCAEYYTQAWMDDFFPQLELKYKVSKGTGRWWVRKKNEYDNDKQGWELVGYSTALRGQWAKKSTVLFHDADNIFMEEFMNTDNEYLGSQKDPDKEPRLLVSLVQTIARSNKDGRVRPVKVTLISNLYSMDNPYFRYFHILENVLGNSNSIYQRFYKIQMGDLKYVIEFSQLQPEKTGMEANENDLGVMFQDFRNELHIVEKVNNKKVAFQMTIDDDKYLNVSRLNKSWIVWDGKGKKLGGNVPCYSANTMKKFDTYNIKYFKTTMEYTNLKTLFNMNNLYYDSLQTYIHLTNILAY